MAKEEKLLSKAKADCEVLFAQANTQAINQKEGADQYAQETLFALEEHLSIHLSQVRKGIDVLNKEVPSSMAS